MQGNAITSQSATRFGGRSQSASTPGRRPWAIWFGALAVLICLAPDRGTAQAEMKPDDPAASAGKCPVTGQMGDMQQYSAARAMSLQDWWPNQLDLRMLHQNSALSRNGGRPTMATTVRCSFAWPGTARARTVFLMGVVGHRMARSVSPR
jgi:hypothetical protein